MKVSHPLLSTRRNRANKLQPWYLFREHPESELRRWAAGLSYFRFCRAYGGINNDGDDFRVALGFSGEEQLLQIAETLGFSLRKIPPAAARPVVGKGYTWEEAQHLWYEISCLPNWEQPRFKAIGGVRVLALVERGLLSLYIAGASGNPYEVTEADFNNALTVERYIAPLAERIVDPPQDDRNCISPKYYPEYWLAHA